MISASAATDQITYTIDCTTISRNRSTADIFVKIVGKDGRATGWHNVGEIGKKSAGHASITDVNVGQIVYVELYHNLKGLQYNWAPTTFTVKTNDQSVTIYNSKILSSDGSPDDPNSIERLSIYNSSFKLDIKTHSDLCAGTDADVWMKIRSKNGCEMEVNLSDNHPASNAFEIGDYSTIYFNTYIPFDEIVYVSFRIDEGTWGKIASDWYLDYFTLTKMAGMGAGSIFTEAPYDWVSEDKPVEYFYYY